MWPPEEVVVGALALVRDGDMIELNIKQRKLHLDLCDEELKKRRSGWQGATPRAT
jgi:dihydroxyacid dehydratase/phosphogluconate dehydratase